MDGAAISTTIKDVCIAPDSKGATIAAQTDYLEVLRQQVIEALLQQSPQSPQKSPSRASTSIAKYLSIRGLSFDSLRFDTVTQENALPVAEFISEAFASAQEPFDTSLCFHGEDQIRLNFIMLKKIAVMEETRPLSAVCLVEDEVVAATVILPPEDEANIVDHRNPEEEEFETDSHRRLFGVMQYIDNVIKDEVSGLPELFLSAVHPEFRGSFGVDKQSLYQRMVTTSSEQVAKHWNGLFSFSNDTSTPRHLANGWKIVAEIPYTDLPRDCAITPVEDKLLTVCCCRLNEDKDEVRSTCR